MKLFRIPTRSSLRCLPVILLGFTAILNAQVGINTTDPQATLDVNGDLRIRNIPAASGNFLLTIDSDGHVSKFKSFLLYEATGTIASTSVEKTMNGDDTDNNINLGLQTTVTIPRNVQARVIINYSVPMGTMLGFYPPSTYMGIRFLKDGAEVQGGSRKVTAISDSYGNTNEISNMTTISNVYIETFAPSEIQRTFTYVLKGYIEQHVDGGNATYKYKFNMWDNGSQNYNWGKGTITHQTYIK